MKLAVKKAFCLFLCTVMASTLLMAGARASAAQVLVGDVNGDQKINVCDVARFYAHFQGNSLAGEDAMTRSDLDDSGWLYPSYVEKLYDKVRGCTLQDLIAAVSQLPEDAVCRDRVTVEGRVASIQSVYDPNYNNISVVLQVSDTNEQILCYRMTGAEVERISVSDTIIVTGYLRNYRGSVEFAAGCECRISRGISTANDYNQYLEELTSYLPLGVSPRPLV